MWFLQVGQLYKFGDFDWNIDGFHCARFSYESDDRTGNEDPRSRRGLLKGTILGLLTKITNKCWLWQPVFPARKHSSLPASH